MNTSGNWNIILQTDRILQRVALDTCTKPGYPCTGITACGKRSQCVQRFNHQVNINKILNFIANNPESKGFKSLYQTKENIRTTFKNCKIM